VISEDDINYWREGIDSNGHFLPTGKSTGNQWFYYSTGRIADLEGVMAFESSTARVAKGSHIVNPAQRAQSNFKLRKGDTVKIVVDMNKRQVLFFKNQNRFKDGKCSFASMNPIPKLYLLAYIFGSEDSLTITKYTHTFG
jgi:hypothetical protein